MKRIMPIDQVEEANDFPYDFSRWNYTEDTLRSFLYSPDDPNLTDDDHCLVLDYDGFIEWFPEWNNMYPDDKVYEDDEGAEYLPYHIGRTVSPVRLKGVY